MTKWSTERYGVRNPWLELHFDAPVAVDSVLLESTEGAPNEFGVWAEIATGDLTPVTTSIRTKSMEPPSGMRRAATAMLEKYGFNYLVLLDNDYYFNDFQKYPAFWGIRPVAQTVGATLYRLE